MAKEPKGEEWDTIVRYLNMRRRVGWRAKLDPVEWWNWFQGKRMDRYVGTHPAPVRPRRVEPEESARIGTELMVKGRQRRKDGHE